MSATIRESAFLRSLLAPLAMLGHRTPAAFANLVDGDGHCSMYLNFTASTPHSDDVQVWISTIQNLEAWPEHMRTMSHSAGRDVGGNFMVRLALESPASLVGEHAKLMYDLLQILRGIDGAPIELAISAHGVLPTVKGVLGEAATVVGDSVMLGQATLGGNQGI